ncbi:MAG: MotA/TolQ/ExbB proton channel family protein [Verrucomicrobiales bacterium]
MAQDAADTASEAAKDKSMLTLIKEGGWAMWPLGLLSIGVIALAVYNFIQITRAKYCPVELKAGLMEHMANVRARSAIELVASSPSFLGRMIAYSFPKIDATDPENLGRENVEEMMAEFSVRENRAAMGPIGYLSLISQAAPMLGLLGTVSGMIGAFNTLMNTAGADPNALAGDISEALVTTATGLIIALPALFFYFFFKNRLADMISDCHIAAEEMIDASLMAINADQHMAKVPEGLHA